MALWLDMLPPLPPPSAPVPPAKPSCRGPGSHAATAPACCLPVPWPYLATLPILARLCWQLGMVLLLRLLTGLSAPELVLVLARSAGTTPTI